MTTTVKTEYKYIEKNEQNVPIIAGTTMKVIELVEAKFAYGWSPEELHLNHSYLTMGQIHSAFVFYWDNKEELDADMERRFQYVKQAEKEAGESPLVKKLRAKGLIQ